jgi:hypothetical protein
MRRTVPPAPLPRTLPHLPYFFDMCAWVASWRLWIGWAPAAAMAPFWRGRGMIELRGVDASEGATLVKDWEELPAPLGECDPADETEAFVGLLGTTEGAIDDLSSLTALSLAGRKKPGRK